MIYEPIGAAKKDQWIEWLNGQVKILDGKKPTRNNDIFETDSSDVDTAKDLVGNLLALLTNKPVKID